MSETVQLEKRRTYKPPTGKISSSAVRVAQGATARVVGTVSASPAVRWMRAVRGADNMQLADGYSRRSHRSKWEGNSSLKSLVGRSKAASRRSKTARRRPNMAQRVAKRWIERRRR